LPDGLDLEVPSDYPLITLTETGASMASIRVEATLPEPRGLQLAELADELNVTKSDLVQEAVSLLITALSGARRGQRVAMIDAASREVVTEVTTPLLTQIEWTVRREKIILSRREAAKVDELLSNPPEPTPALRKAMARRKATQVK
jgi:uncharacterized protein (DUF1778 family)